MAIGGPPPHPQKKTPKGPDTAPHPRHCSLSSLLGFAFSPPPPAFRHSLLLLRVCASPTSASSFLPLASRLVAANKRGKHERERAREREREKERVATTVEGRDHMPIFVYLFCVYFGWWRPFGSVISFVVYI
jgi:hypothetical protein